MSQHMIQFLVSLLLCFTAISARPYTLFSQNSIPYANEIIEQIPYHAATHSLPNLPLPIEVLMLDEYRMEVRPSSNERRQCVKHTETLVCPGSKLKKGSTMEGKHQDQIWNRREALFGWLFPARARNICRPTDHAYMWSFKLIQRAPLSAESYAMLQVDSIFSPALEAASSYTP